MEVNDKFIRDILINAQNVQYTYPVNKVTFKNGKLLFDCGGFIYSQFKNNQKNIKISEIEILSLFEDEYEQSNKHV